MTAPTLLGPRVRLRAAVPADIDARQRLGWHRDIERNYGHECDTRAMTEDEAHGWYASIEDRDSDTYWVIESAGELAGVAFLHSLNGADRKARFAIGMFAPQYLGRGLGAESTMLVLSHAFRDLGLHRVDLRVLAFNNRAIDSYRRCGFIEEGRERDSCWLEGRWHDDIIMGLLDSEFGADLKRPPS